ncbi:hypothetical protein BVRB_3g063850 [Beta vulgaris subsp. vulgaris]|nr:hypothetical protein BVRB_3g063850 [Beta vulgaris subsp. vulgaris]
MEAAFQSGFASALLDILFNRVTDVFLTELKKIKNVYEAVDKLETTVIEAQSLLLQVDSSHFQGIARHAMKKRVDTLTGLCYDAEDVMDEIVLLMSKDNLGSGKKIWWFRDAILRYLKTWAIGHGISKLQIKFNAILEQLKDLIDLSKKTSNGCRDLTSEVPSDREGSNPVPLVGRDNDVDEIIKMLTSHHSEKGVSIVGMDGLGKTMLAQHILCDPRIDRKFPIKLWVPISDGYFNKQDVCDRLDKGAVLVNCKSEAEESSDNNVALKLQQNLLIVFDNLLKMKLTDWDDFWVKISAKKVGEIKIFVTTSNASISKSTGTCAYNLKPLSDESCKTLIEKKVCLHNPNLCGQPEFSYVAGKLASKCEGLPFVARIIGLVLATSHKNDWSDLLEKDLSHWPEFKAEIFPVLSLGFKDMQLHVKKFLSYFSLFPQNYCFVMDDLAQLWVGEGFIEQLNDSSSLQAYVDALLETSIFQVCEDANHAGRPSYQLHKFTHDFAQVVASKTCLQIQELGTYKRIRTILSLHADNKNVKMPKIPRHLFKSLTHLRVLALSGTDVAEVPDSINKLEHLRYLDVSNTALSNLPDKLSTLSTLQFLKLKNTALSHLPKDFHKLTSLLFVDWDKSELNRLTLPAHIGNLSSLQTLPLFHVGNKDGYSITELQNMNHLHGAICITNLENVKDREEAKAAMLHKKTSLRRIELQWNKSTNSSLARDILTGLRPPLYLKELKITAYCCYIFPDWIAQPLPMLEKIHLQRCHSCTVLPAFGQLPALRTLIIQEMESITSVSNSFCGQLVDGKCFPSLNTLEFNDMPKLEDCTGLEATRMPQLRVLKFVNCPMMNTLPLLRNLTSLKDLQIRRCKSLVTLPDVLPALESLIISESDKLEAKQYQTGGSKERRKVEYIPYIEINGELI